MPEPVTTPEAFDEVMMRASLDDIRLRGILERSARAERELETIREALSQAGLRPRTSPRSKA
jgi:hypothetical protein